MVASPRNPGLFAGLAREADFGGGPRGVAGAGGAGAGGGVTARGRGERAEAVSGAGVPCGGRERSRKMASRRGLKRGSLGINL